MCDDQVFGLTTEIETIKVFFKEQFYVIKRSIADITKQSEKQKFILFLQEQNKLLIDIINFP